MIRANRKFEWFRRIGWRAIKIGVSIAIDSRESRCESPVPLRVLVLFLYWWWPHALTPALVKERVTPVRNLGIFWKGSLDPSKASFRKWSKFENKRRDKIMMKHIHTITQRRRDDNKNKSFAFEGGGLWGREKNRPKTLVFVGNATTIKFWKWTFYCREILLSLRRLLITARTGSRFESQEYILGMREANHTISGIWPLLFGFCAISTRLPEERMGVAKKKSVPQRIPVKMLQKTLPKKKKKRRGINL